MSLHEVQIAPEPIERLSPITGPAAIAEEKQIGESARAQLTERAVWNVNSAATGGGVAEMLRSLLPYVRGFGIDARWVVIDGTPEFFRITKRLHHALHGSEGDGSPLADAERAIYETVLQTNADELSAVVRPRDIVILHDPQTAGLAPPMARLGAIVIWRCHVGADAPNEEVERGWTFLAPFLQDVAAAVFSRRQYIPKEFDSDRSVVIPPSIDPFSPKNQELGDDVVRAILVHTGLIDGPSGDASPTFVRSDGSPGRVDRRADIIRLGRAPLWETALVVQVSRWDPLKDPVGVMEGFAVVAEREPLQDTELTLGGPNVNAIEDDPESAQTFNQVLERWRALPHHIRDRVHLASLPMADLEENGAIVNALQRHAAIIIQKSLKEGFGLTVTEGMWKRRPVVASAVGGIQDQIIDEVHGLLLPDPTHLESLASRLERLLLDSELGHQLGQRAHERVKSDYLPLRHLRQYAELLERVDIG
jgi:trehalose synthase